MQLIKAATQDVPKQTPMPQMPKQMPYAYPIPPMHIIVWLLPGRQNSILFPMKVKAGAGPYPQPERGHEKSVDEGSVSKVALKDA